MDDPVTVGRELANELLTARSLVEFEEAEDALGGPLFSDTLLRAINDTEADWTARVSLVAALTQLAFHAVLHVADTTEPANTPARKARIQQAVQGIIHSNNVNGWKWEPPPGS